MHATATAPVVKSAGSARTWASIVTFVRTSTASPPDHSPPPYSLHSRSRTLYSVSACSPATVTSHGPTTLSASADATGSPASCVPPASSVRHAPTSTWSLAEVPPSFWAGGLLLHAHSTRMASWLTTSAADGGGGGSVGGCPPRRYPMARCLRCDSVISGMAKGSCTTLSRYW